MNKIRVALICNYWHFECEKSSSRYRTLVELFVEHGFDVTLITSDFYHQSKKHREFSDDFLNSFEYKVRLVHEKGYKKNISFKRLSSHKSFAKNVVKYLQTDHNYDVIYCPVPSLSLGKSVVKYAHKMNIPVVIDLQDLWPEAFKMAINIPLLSNILFYPMKRRANWIYSHADGLVAVSNEYMQRMLDVRKDKFVPHVVAYLGNEFQIIENIRQKITIKKNNEFVIGYAGALGHSYDIDSVIKAVKILKDEGLKDIRFDVYGDGVLKSKFEDLAQKLDVNVLFKGFKPFNEIIHDLLSCDVVVNPIVKKSSSSIINKVADYAAIGKPVVNSSPNKEYASLVEKYQVGLTVPSEDSVAIAKALKMLYENEELRFQMGDNHVKLAKELFDRKKTYLDIIKLVKEIGCNRGK